MPKNEVLECVCFFRKGNQRMFLNRGALTAGQGLSWLWLVSVFMKLELSPKLSGLTRIQTDAVATYVPYQAGGGDEGSRDISIGQLRHPHTTVYLVEPVSCAMHSFRTICPRAWLSNN